MDRVGLTKRNGVFTRFARRNLSGANAINFFTRSLETETVRVVSVVRKYGPRVILTLESATPSSRRRVDLGARVHAWFLLELIPKSGSGGLRIRTFDGLTYRPLHPLIIPQEPRSTRLGVLQTRISSLP